MIFQSDEVIAVFSFQKGSISGKLIAELIEEGFGFEIKYIDTGLKSIRSGKCNIRNRLEQIKGIEDYVAISFKSDKDTDNPRVLMNRFHTIDFITLHLDKDVISNSDIFDRLAMVNGFTFGYLSDREFNYIQNLTDIYWYQYHGIDHECLPKKSNGLPFPLEEQIVDISVNPCRVVEFPGLKFSLSSRIWVNEPFVRNLIPDFEKCNEFCKAKRKISETISFMELSTSLRPTEADMQKFHELSSLLDLKRLDVVGKELIRKKPVNDATDSIQTKVINNENFTEVTSWVDSQGKPAKESKAVNKIVRLFRQR